MSLKQTLRRRGVVAGAIGLAIAAVAASQPAAWAAPDSDGRTVIAQLAADGAVTKVSALGGASTPAAADLPITLKVSGSAGGKSVGADQLGKTNGTLNLTYAVANKASKTQDISYVDSTGATQTMKVDVQVPYVAQLDVIFGKGWSNVHAPNAATTSLPDGSLDVRWSMVLFSPLGAGQQSLGLTATSEGKSAPLASLTARVVNPVSADGLSNAQVDANATLAENQVLGSYADGAKSGLDSLAAGAASLLAGLNQLAAGAQALHAGLVTGQAGTDQLAQGLHSTTGQPDLVSGSKQLASGVNLISAGLGQLSNTTSGLPAALAGVGSVVAGVNQLVAGLGDNASPNTVFHGITLLDGGTADLSAGIDQLSAGVGAEINKMLNTLKPGLSCAQKVILDVANGAAAGADPCYTGGFRPALPGISDPTSNAVLQGTAAGLGTAVAGIGTQGSFDANTFVGGLDQIAAGLSNPACNPLDPKNPANPCGEKQGLAAVQAGLGQLRGGLTIIDGGLSTPACLNPNTPPPVPPCGVAEGLLQIKAGLKTAVDGVDQLSAGSKSAAVGAGQLSAGLGQESAGLDQLAAGLPDATSGSAQIADGLNAVIDGTKQLSDGQVQVRDAAVVPIAQALSQGGGNASATIAVLTALSDSAAKPPLGANTTLLLTQSDGKSTTSWPLWLTLTIAGVMLLLGLAVGTLIGRRRKIARARFEHAA